MYGTSKVWMLAQKGDIWCIAAKYCQTILITDAFPAVETCLFAGMRYMHSRR